MKAQHTQGRVGGEITGGWGWWWGSDIEAHYVNFLETEKFAGSKILRQCPCIPLVRGGGVAGKVKFRKVKKVDAFLTAEKRISCFCVRAEFYISIGRVALW
jgi:hypothetical protein